MSIDVHMKTFYHVVGDALRQGPPETLERLTPWIIWPLGVGMLAIMFYCWAAAWFG
jgi:hypothetical protein